MENTLLINQIEVKKNKEISRIQKEFLKSARKIKNKNVKAKLGKFVKLTTNECLNSSSNSIIADFSNDLRKQQIQEMSKSELLNFIESKKIIGMSGSCFPLAQKLKTTLSSQNKHTLIINAVECEPSLLHDNWILNTYEKELAFAISQIKRLGFDEIIIAAKSPVTIQKIGEYDITYVAAKYPFGCEKILIKEILGIEIEAKTIPANEGIAVVNVQTVLSLYNALISEKENEGRFITVADFIKENSTKNGNAKICYVTYGTNIENFAKSIFGTKEGIIFTGGGILAGHKVMNEELITEGTCIIGLLPRIVEFNNDSKCKMCGKCSKFVLQV